MIHHSTQMAVACRCRGCLFFTQFGLYVRLAENRCGLANRGEEIGRLGRLADESVPARLPHRISGFRVIVSGEGDNPAGGGFQHQVADRVQGKNPGHREIDNDDICSATQRLGHKVICGVEYADVLKIGLAPDEAGDHLGDVPGIVGAEHSNAIVVERRGRIPRKFAIG